MGSAEIFTEIDKNPCRVNRSLEEFNKLVKKAESIPSSGFKERFFDLAIANLDNAIQNQKDLEDELVEGSDHYKLCFKKLLFLEEIGRHEMACISSFELVGEISEYSNILLDMADSCCTKGNQEEARNYRDVWEMLNIEK